MFTNEDAFFIIKKICCQNRLLLIGSTGGLRIVRALCSQGIVLLRNLTKRELVCTKRELVCTKYVKCTFRKAIFQEKKVKNRTISGNSYY